MGCGKRYCCKSRTRWIWSICFLELSFFCFSWNITNGIEYCSVCWKPKWGKIIRINYIRIHLFFIQGKTTMILRYLERFVYSSYFKFNYLVLWIHTFANIRVRSFQPILVSLCLDKNDLLLSFFQDKWSS
jgi:hypothetical protein